MATLLLQILANLKCYSNNIERQLCKPNQSRQPLTNCTRKNHFLKWCEDMGINTAGTHKCDLQARFFIIACYTVSHEDGKMIQLLKIRHATLTGHIIQASKCHIDWNLPSPCRVQVDYIKTITDAVKKYKIFPHFQEIFYNIMFNKMIAWHKNTSNVIVLCEWMFHGK